MRCRWLSVWLSSLVRHWLEQSGQGDKTPLTCGASGGRYWDRTSDLFRVREARYRCANRPCCHGPSKPDRGSNFEVEKGFEPS